MDDAYYSDLEQKFAHRYRLKKVVNLWISLVIVILGIISVIFIWFFDGEGILTFRWMTVNGTLFTTAISLFYLVVGCVEIVAYTEMTSGTVYFARLASAVAECLIMIVVLLSQLPFFPEHMHIFRFDMFNMHIFIPLLTVLSFVLNDSPRGKLSAREKLQGTWFITLYTVVILSLIISGVVKRDKIPYFFLDVTHMHILQFFAYLGFVYLLGFLLASLLSFLNRKLSWIWFKNIIRS